MVITQIHIYYYPIKESNTFSVSNWITIGNSFVTVIVGVWLGVTFKRNYDATKAVKDYFIAQSTLISNDYSLFITSLCNNQLSAADTQAWFKKMAIRIKNFERFLTAEFSVNADLLKRHNAFKKYFTATEAFNDNFSEPTLKLTGDLKTVVDGKHSIISIAFTQIVIDIIKAKKK